jgi:hypothetical protein
MTMHNNAPSSNQTNKPQHRKNQNWHQQKLRIMQKGQRIISQKGNISVINEGRQIKRIPQKGGQKITRRASQQRKKQELHNIEMQVQREECAIGDVEAVSEFELVLFTGLYEETLCCAAAAGTGAAETG